jgi:hypothetical protein
MAVFLGLKTHYSNGKLDASKVADATNVQLESIFFNIEEILNYDVLWYWSQAMQATQATQGFFAR